MSQPVKVEDDGVRFRIKYTDMHPGMFPVHNIEGEVFCNKCGWETPVASGHETMQNFIEWNVGYATGLLEQHRKVCQG